MRLSSTPSTYILLVTIAMTWPPRKDCSASAEAWTLMLRVSMAHFAAFIHVEGDLAEVHVVQLLVQRDRVAADGGNGATLGLPGIEIGGGENNLVARAPLGGVQDLDRGGACIGRGGQLGPGVGPRSVEVQGSARKHDAAVTHAHHLFIL